jgi:DNA-binding NarL/FixJ family response regulator
VLELLCEGCYYKEIAKKLGISISTVGTYVKRIYEKLCTLPRPSETHFSHLVMLIVIIMIVMTATPAM